MSLPFKPKVPWTRLFPNADPKGKYTVWVNELCACFLFVLGVLIYCCCLFFLFIYLFIFYFYFLFYFFIYILTYLFTYLLTYAFEAVGRRIDPSRWTQLQFGQFSVPTSGPQLVYQRRWYVLFCLWKSAYKRSLAAYRKE